MIPSVFWYIKFARTAIVTTNEQFVKVYVKLVLLYKPDPRRIPLRNGNMYTIIMKVPPRSCLMQSYCPQGGRFCFWPCSIGLIKSDIFCKSLFRLCLENEIYSKAFQNKLFAKSCLLTLSSTCNVTVSPKLEYTYIYWAWFGCLITHFTMYRNSCCRFCSVTFTNLTINCKSLLINSLVCVT